MASSSEGRERTSFNSLQAAAGVTNQKRGGGRQEHRISAGRSQMQSMVDIGPKLNSDAVNAQDKGGDLTNNFGKLSLSGIQLRAKNDGSHVPLETTDCPSKRSRNRHKKERGEDSNPKIEGKIPVVDSDENQLLVLLEAQKKAEEDAAAAELKRIADLQRQNEAKHAALLQEKIQLEAKISAACQRLETNFVQVTDTHKLWRSRLTIDKLASTRANFQLNKKNLKSDLKKCTAFCKKIKSTTSWDAPGVIASMIGDIETLNLSRYIEEIVSAFLECKMKVSDISSLVLLCITIHERYEEFRDLFIPKLTTAVSSKVITSNDDVKQKRIFLRFLTELLLAGVIQDPKPLVRIVSDACGAPSLTNDKDKNVDGVSYQVADAHMVVAFAKAAGHEIFGVIPSNVIEDMDILKRIITKDDVATSSLTNQPQAILTTRVRDSDNDELNIEESNEYSVSFSSIELAKATLNKVMRVCDALAIPESVSSILRTHVAGAFKTLCVSYVNTHKKLVKLEKRCEEDRLLSGSLTEQREKGLADAQRLMETLEKSVETLADILDETVPELVVEVEESDIMIQNESSGVELYKKECDRDSNLGPFDDEETRLFYCDIPDFLSIPPALLGYTVDEVEKLRAANTLRFKSADLQTDIDESVTLNADTDTFPVSGESMEDGVGVSNDENNNENDGDAKVESNQDKPHFKLLALIEQDLPECNRRDKIDDLAERFCVNHGTSKAARKRIQKAIVQVRRQDLLPFFSRLTAIFDRVYPEIASQVVTEIEQQFHGMARWKKQQNLEYRMRNARYLGELTKFRVAPPIVALRCLKRCILDFSGYNVDVACCLLESCGRYLHRSKVTNSKLVEIMDSMNRLRKVKFLDDRYNALIDSALFMVVPPPVAQKERKVLDPMEAYLLDLLIVRLTPDDKMIALAKKQIGRLPWSDPLKRCGYLVAKYILKACRRGRYNAVNAVVGLMLSLKKEKPEVYIRVLDTLIEELQYFLELPNSRDHQRVLSYARLLGEMFNRGLVGFPVITAQLYNIVNYGHAIPPALREASLKTNEDIVNLKSLSSKLLLKGPSGASRTIKEDEEFEENSEPDESFYESSRSRPVAVSPFSKFDPRVTSLIDPPSAVFRIKLVCTILDSSVASIGNQNKGALNQFLASFQRYIFTKSSIPADIEFAILDSFDLIDSRLRSLNMDVNSRKIVEGYGITRYKTWYEAHNVTVSYEEKDTIAAKRFEDSNMTLSGDSATLNEEMLLNEDAGSSSESDDDGDDSAVDQLSQESDVDIAGEDPMDGASLDHRSNDDKDEDNEASEDDDISLNEDEDEVDEETLQKNRERKLEEDMFDQELRRITLEAIEKGKIAARTGFGGKVSDSMPSASHFIKKKIFDVAGDSKDNPSAAMLTGGGGVQFNFLKKGHKGRVEAKSLVVPSDSNIAKVLSKQDNEAIREKNILKARVLQYEVENSEMFPTLASTVGPKMKDRHRPLSMEDIDNNFK